MLHRTKSEGENTKRIKGSQQQTLLRTCEEASQFKSNSGKNKIDDDKPSDCQELQVRTWLL
jgi:uncharacterized protein CbrC (UPF0167 family)